jgi:hypothetical protein
MSTIDEYPQNGYFLVANGSGTELGSYSHADWGDIELATIRIFNRDVAVAPFSYQLRLVISSKQGGPVLAASDWLTFSNDTTLQTTANWLGDVSFSFTDYALKGTETYFLRLESTGYARSEVPNENDLYLGVWCDWLQPLGTADTAAARVAFGVRR